MLGIKIKNIPCPNCKKFFNVRDPSQPHGPLSPLILKCGHSVCESCVRSGIRIQGVVICQLCQSKSFPDKSSSPECQEDFPVNIFLLGQLTFKKSQCMDAKIGFAPAGFNFNSQKRRMPTVGSTCRSDASQKNKEPCSECSKWGADWKCMQCDALYCTNCFNKVHQVAKALQKHKKFAVGNIVEKSGITVPTCEEHPDQKLDFFCLKCEVLACVHCFILSHEGHNVCTLKKRNEENMEQLQVACDKARGILKRLQHTQKEINMVTSVPSSSAALNGVELDIRSHFLHLHSLLQLQELSLLEKFETSKTASYESLKIVTQQVKDNISELKTLLDESTFAFEPENLSKVDISSLIRKLDSASENVCCYLVADEDPTVTIIPKFDVQESIFQEIENHVHLEFPAISGFSLVAYEDLPSNYEIKELEDDSTKDLSSTLRSSPISAFSEQFNSCESLNQQLSETSSVQDIKETLDKVCSINDIETGCKMLVKVCHLKDPSSFYVQKVSDEKRLRELSNELKKCYSSGRATQTTFLKEGYLYMVKYTVDNSWCRVRVKSIIPGKNSDETMAEVLYIDYGNVEIIPQKRCRLIPPKLAQHPIMAIHCKLYGVAPVEGGWTDDAIKTFAQMVDGHEVLMVVIKYNFNLYHVDLCGLESTDVPISVREALIFLEHGYYNESTDITPITARPTSEQGFLKQDFKEGDIIDVTISHINSPASFYVQRLGVFATSLASLMRQLNKSIIDGHKTGYVYMPEIGMPCAAQFSEDKNWYRAVVTNLPGKKLVEVFYVDFGNSEIIHWSCLRKLKSRFLEMSQQAVHCSLSDVIPNAGLGWSKDAKNFLLRSTAKKNLKLYVDKIEERHLKVTLYDSQKTVDICLNALLVREGYATSIGISSNLVEYHKSNTVPFASAPHAASQNAVVRELIKVAPVDPKETYGYLPEEPEVESQDESKDGIDPFRLEVKVLAALSPGCLYLSLVDQEHLIKKLYEDLQIHYNSTLQTEVNWKVGNLCCVYCSIDLKWYRGLIIELKDESAQVFLKDFARVIDAPIAHMRLLEPTFLRVADGAIKVHLAGIKAAGDKAEWPCYSCEYMQELLSSYNVLFITKKGDVENQSLPVDLWVTDFIDNGPFEPTIEKWDTINLKLVEKGLALPVKSDNNHQMVPSYEVLKELEERNMKYPSKFDIPEELQRKQSLEDKNEESQCASNKVPRHEKVHSYLESDGRDDLESWIPAIPLTKFGFTAIPSYVDDDCYIYLHDKACEETLSLITKVLNSQYADSQPKPHDLYWFPHQLCIAQYHVDKNWYRSEVLQVNDDRTVKVRFVDYGNVEICKATELRKNIFMYEIPIQCHKCCLNGILPASEDNKWPVNVLDLIHTTIVEKECQVIIKQIPGDGRPIPIDIIGPGNQNIGELLVRIKYALYNLTPVVNNEEESDSESDVIVEVEQSTVSCSDDSRTELEVLTGDKKQDDNENRIAASYSQRLIIPDDVNKMTVKVLALLSPTELFINILSYKEDTDDDNEEDESPFEMLMSQLQNEAPLQHLLENPQKGDVCCACFTEDNKWYRAAVLSSSESGITVQYVDYGNVELVPYNRVRKLKDSWLNLPIQLLSCTLWNIKPVDTTDDVLTRVSDCLLSKQGFTAVIKERSPNLQIELFDLNDDILAYESLLAEGIFSRLE